MSNMSISGMKKPQITPPSVAKPTAPAQAAKSPSLSDSYSQAAQQAMKSKPHK